MVAVGVIGRSMGEGTHFLLVGSLEAGRVIVGPHVKMGFDVHGTEGALGWAFERMNELERVAPSAGGDTRVVAGPQHERSAASGAWEPVA